MSKITNLLRATNRVAPEKCPSFEEKLTVKRVKAIGDNLEGEAKYLSPEYKAGLKSLTEARRESTVS